ncbi:AAA family ATPase [Rhizobium leguminosarum]|uniref:Putative ATPase n=1 Tax=Rhizobium leguminosarum TaxID=384 RepID=A0A7W9ZNM0_RHILE|nr:AAA family ATPase [Rhizobium leguminosarum]MBB6219991.1 putative ATPase [Rhizobium leguminosarum]
MQKLRVTNFSCIKYADLETASLTILIGPQASGKSVLSKLLYFFNNILITLHNSAEEQLSAKELGEAIGADFVRWFPPSAWGARIFHIRFEAGPFEIKIKRKGSTTRLSDKIQVSLAPDIRVHYEALLLSVKTATETTRSQEFGQFSSKSWEISYKLRRENEGRLEGILGEAYVDFQLFVPAGRSWFTSVGKAISAFEHGGLLDPVTLDFGRLFTNVRDRARSGLPVDSSATEQRLRNQLTVKLFGGRIRFEREKEYVEADDGRRIPFSVLSSGQQELLPLWLVLSQMSNDIQSQRRKISPTMLYIEEPEAHLFPTAQSTLLDYLASLTSDERLRRSMIITTHSPYVLSKFNNLLKAGSLGFGADKRQAQKVNEIVPRISWLNAKRTRAYAIVDGTLTDILTEDGLIDGEYLDAVSGEISKDFLRLLDLEYGDV